MSVSSKVRIGIIAVVLGSGPVGCEKQSGRSKVDEAEAPPAVSVSAEDKPGHDAPTPRPAHALPTDPGVVGGSLELAGITMAIPQGWVAQPVAPGPMGPKAIFRLPADDDDSGGCDVRVTHFPAMKGMDDANLQRWLQQVRRPDGKPSTLDDAVVTKKQVGDVGLTILDVTGVLQSQMGGAAQGGAGTRLIAAIVNHPQGPHFVKATGNVDSMKKWEHTVEEFLTSAKIE